jgi:hypothetical protein
LRTSRIPDIISEIGAVLRVAIALMVTFIVSHERFQRRDQDAAREGRERPKLQRGVLKEGPPEFCNSLFGASVQTDKSRARKGVAYGIRDMSPLETYQSVIEV